MVGTKRGFRTRLSGAIRSRAGQDGPVTAEAAAEDDPNTLSEPLSADAAIVVVNCSPEWLDGWDISVAFYRCFINRITAGI